MSDPQARRCQKLLSGYDFLLGSRRRVAEVVETTSVDDIGASPEIVGEFARFVDPERLPEVHRELTAKGLREPLSDGAALLLSSLLSARLSAVQSIQIPVEQTRFLPDFLGEYFRSELLGGRDDGLTPLYGDAPFTCFGIDLDSVATVQPLDQVRYLPDDELASYRAIASGHDGDAEIASVFCEDLVAMLRGLPAQLEGFVADDPRLLLCIPNWITLRDTEDVPYDPRGNLSVSAQVRSPP